jgi:hypothetical protein
MGAGDDVVTMLQEQIVSMRTQWQRQVWDLEAKVRELKSDLEETRKRDEEGEMCPVCGRGGCGGGGGEILDDGSSGKVSSVNRPRQAPRTGTVNVFARGM